jgi:hypothetical protein
MKKINLFLLTFLCLGLFSNAQVTFGNFYGTYSGVGYSVQQTNDNGYIITGYDNAFEIFGGGKTIVIKTDFKGDTLWTKKYYDEDEQGIYIRQTTDGGYIFANSLHITKIDSIGNILWAMPYSVNSVQQTTDNGYIGIGNKLIKANANGDTLWTKPIKGFFVQQTTDNGYIIFDDDSGTTSLIKTNANGNTLWTKSYNTGCQDGTSSGQQTIDGGYIVLYNSGNETSLIKTDINGDSLWTKTYLLGEQAHGYSVQQTFDGGYIIAGDGPYLKSLLFKVNANGDSLWTHNYYNYDFYNYNFSTFYSVQQTNDNGYVAVGCAYNPATPPIESRIYLVKTDKNGNGCFFTSTYQYQEICIVTVDTTSGKNMIIWEKNDSVGIESFNIYKQGSIAGVYDSITNVSFDSLSIFIDNTSNPAQHADLYKISIIDTCGFKSDLSYVHKTIHLSVSGSVAQGFELIWDEYMGFNVGTYYIYRGTNNDIVLIDSVAGNLYSWTDVNPPSNNVYYQVAVFSPNPCNPTGGSKMIYDKSVSNIADNETGINEITDNGNFDIYPNPNKGTFHLNFCVEKPENIIIQVINDLGQNVYKQEHKKFKGNYNKEIDISSLKNGIYMLNIRVGENTYTRNISVMR